MFQKKIAIFKTVDGEIHRGCKYKWCRVSGLLCSYDEYIMITIKDDGYLKDESDLMYPLTNIISIQWELEDEYKKANAKFDSFQIWFTNSEIEKISCV